MARDRETHRTIATNRRAKRAFEVLDEVECGIQLKGTEVKSLRSGQASIAEAYGRIRDGELFLVGATIPLYSHGTANNHEPERERKLLAHAQTIERWGRKVRERGVTVVPLELYFRGHLVKIRMALGKGRKLHDKREVTKTRMAAREIEREQRRRR